MASDSAIADSSQSTGTKASIIAAAIEVFTRQIEQWKRKRAPPGLEQKLRATRNADRMTTARILLDYGGFVAWVAYSLATEGKAHFKGRLRQENTIKAFKALPFKDRVNTARTLARLELSSATRRHIYHISSRLEDKATSASLEGVADVFGEYMCNAIRRVAVLSDGIPALKAGVTMQFPDLALHDCVMMLEVCESEVEHLVKGLFGVDVTSVMGIRHLILGKGVKLTSNTSNPEITLKGVRSEAIVHIFGPEIHEAIMASRMRKRELEEEKNPATECVSMIFTSKSGEGAYVSLSLELEGGSRIRKKLYS
ncbi:hypothetical protein BU23DRAFT_640222 [Bimuria novae-zelandiae CBS 107.79]|uniref:Uncharacterized protein n=1 Tax=Bimuria novae-zelandiae CBS 107.79 TaxID=1447943 RepID=A0A6A5UJC7_9PLEO|nr:hypothetical protein BU23DRAFT_640222 [Bimuria novae-zelandiae CBS 107.79]